MIILLDYSLKNHSTMKIESLCKKFCIVQNTQDVVDFCIQNKEFFVLGKGSNTLFANEMNCILHFGQHFSNTEIQDEIIICQSGKSIVSLAKQAAANGLSGLEFASGIPASVGGAISMNAGAFGSDFSKITLEAEAFDLNKHKIVNLNNADCHFGYRKSIFSKKNHIILSVKLALKKKEKSQIYSQMRQNYLIRKQNQPIDKFSLGSVFLSDKYPAAKLIDELGLKGLRIGNAEISQKHSGFIINLGGATSADIKQLIEIIRQKVNKRYKFLRKEEIRIV